MFINNQLIDPLFHGILDLVITEKNGLYGFLLKKNNEQMSVSYIYQKETWSKQYRLDKW